MDILRMRVDAQIFNLVSSPSWLFDIEKAAKNI